MKSKYSAIATLLLTGLIISVSVTGTSINAVQAQGGSFADPAFQHTWEHTDALVASGKVKRSFYWGPQPNTGPLQEDYLEGQGGKRLVQYFDKSRMEINHPNGDKNNPFYVTNGRLAVELITGQVQVGNNKFLSRPPAEIPLAGDTDDEDAPTYYSLIGAIYNVWYPEADAFGVSQLGPVITTTLSRKSGAGQLARFASYGIKNVYYEKTTKRAIPAVFWDFLNTTGPVMVAGKQQTARLSDPYFYTTGYPMTNAFWASVKIAGKPNIDVLIQAYERRVLTYVPSFPKEFQVQMGNIGQHYYDWRYKNVGFRATCKHPTGGFGKLWSTDISVLSRLQCAGDYYQAHFQIQHFERGHMVSMQFHNPPDRTSSIIPEVFVFAPDGSVKVNPLFEDRKWGDPGPGGPPPPGLLRPTGKIGQLWRESAEARSLVGWATSPIRDVRPEEWLLFEKGLMLAEGDKIYLLDSIDLFYATPNTWSEYPNPIPIPPPARIEGCKVTAQGSMGQLWGENLVVQNRLGCPIDLQPESMAFQPFGFTTPGRLSEKGIMLYLGLKDGSTNMMPSKTIYALFRSGLIQRYEDTYNMGDPEPTPVYQPPRGYYEPRLGFGKVWRDNKLQAVMGHATEPEMGIAPGDVQFFQSGFMVRVGKQIYVLFHDTPGYFGDARFWTLYDAPE